MVEVLVALVILLIGIYAIMAIFPRGYSAMEATQMRVTASQLAESELARWRLAPESLPDAIVATDYRGEVIPGTVIGRPDAMGTVGTARAMLLRWPNNMTPLPGSTSYTWPTLDTNAFLTLDHISGGLYQPDNLTPCQYDPVSGYRATTTAIPPAYLHPNWQPDSLYLPRTVIGEQIDVQRLSGQAAGVPFYLLSHAPLDTLRKEPQRDAFGNIVLDPMTGQPVLVDVSMDIYDARSWRYVPFTSGNVVKGLGDRQFTCDGATLYFGPFSNTDPAVSLHPAARTFKLDYTANVGGRSVRIYGVTLTVTAGTAPVSSLTMLPGDFAALQVHEKLVPLSVRPATADAWPRNAYYLTDSAKLTGAIEFCPLLLTSPLASDVTLVKVDYRVKDWQILVFDVEVPPGGMVQLPVTGLKYGGYMNPPRQSRPQPVAEGARLFFDTAGNPVNAPNADAASAYVVAVDRQNGDVLTDSETALLELLPSSPYDRRTRVRVDFKDGLLYFNYDPGNVPQGTYNSAVDTPNRAGRTYRVFCRAQADWAVQLLPAARFYARAADPNKLEGDSVGGGKGTVNYVWSTANPGQLYFPLSESGQSVSIDYYASGGRLIEGEVHTIGGPQVVDLRAWVCALSEPLHSPPDSVGPITVRGVSVRARVVWVGRGRVSTLEDVANALQTGTASRPLASLEEGWYQTFVTTFLPRAPI